jgi:hypothetical protein
MIHQGKGQALAKPVSSPGPIMNSRLLNFTRFNSNLTAGQNRSAAGLLKTRKDIMKLKIQFGEETRFDIPSLQAIKTWAQLLPGMRRSLRALAMAERSKPVKCRVD